MSHSIFKMDAGGGLEGLYLKSCLPFSSVVYRLQGHLSVQILKTYNSFIHARFYFNRQGQLFLPLKESLNVFIRANLIMIE